MDEPYLSKIKIYPVKSLDPVEVTEAEIGIRSLKHDRSFAMLSADGHYVNGKRTGLVNQLKATYDLKNGTISLVPRAGGAAQTFELLENNKQLNEYLGDFFKTDLFMVHRTRGELMDIPGASSVTVISEASLTSLQNDMQDHGLDELRLRFRANLEIGGVSPFWEEQLFHEPNIGVRFYIGDVEMIGVSPRARCNVPPQHPFTGESDRGFARKMMKSRKASLPKDSKLPLYGGFYHLTVNTYLPESEKGKMIHIGDPIRIDAPVHLSR